VVAEAPERQFTTRQDGPITKQPANEEECRPSVIATKEAEHQVCIRARPVIERQGNRVPSVTAAIQRQAQAGKARRHAFAR
jgi:hypothetical protein